MSAGKEVPANSLIWSRSVHHAPDTFFNFVCVASNTFSTKSISWLPGNLIESHLNTSNATNPFIWQTKPFCNCCKALSQTTEASSTSTTELSSTTQCHSKAPSTTTECLSKAFEQTLQSALAAEQRNYAVWSPMINSGGSEKNILIFKSPQKSACSYARAKSNEVEE